ncbi:DUF2243 domain-containing protein [Microbacterium sp. NPDC019599]|uniref:DUF2243 domain-containing protein n=1 Tax=Microbacterium sp. NPDC019599 TaxID=3154690 RepID=UPI0033CA902A
MVTVRFPGTGSPSWGARAACSARNAWSGVLLGVSLVAFAGGTVFGPAANRDRFDSLAAAELGGLAEGLVETIGWLAAIAGLFVLGDVARLHGFWWKRWAGGLLLGAGLLQGWASTVQPRLLGFQETRHLDGILPYDLMWSGMAIGLAAAGIALLLRTRRRFAEEHLHRPARPPRS